MKTNAFSNTSILLMAMLALSYTFFERSYACENSERSNADRASSLAHQALAIQTFELGFQKMNEACDRASKLLTKAAAANATAEACVALKENAAMQKDLAETTSGCAHALETTKSSLQYFTDIDVAPLEAEVRSLEEFIREELPDFRNLCPKQARVQVGQLATSKSILARSLLDINSAQGSVTRFSSISIEGDRLAALSTETVKRCGTTDSVEPSQIGQSVGSQKSTAGPSALAHSDKPKESTITGEIKATLKEGLNNALKVTGTAPKDYLQKEGKRSRSGTTLSDRTPKSDVKKTSSNTAPIRHLVDTGTIENARSRPSSGKTQESLPEKKTMTRQIASENAVIDSFGPSLQMDVNILPSPATKATHHSVGEALSGMEQLDLFLNGNSPKATDISDKSINANKGPETFGQNVSTESDESIFALISNQYRKQEIHLIYR